MSSQASSAGGQEAKVREAMVKTGDIDIMCAIRGNFFYTRTVPCEIWFMDKAKPDHLRDKVLMLDARHVFRKVTRKIFDFSPEQMKNLTSIVWLCRGQEERFAGLVQEYLNTARAEAQAADFTDLLAGFNAANSYFAKHSDTADLKAGIAKLRTDADAFTVTAAALPEDAAEITALTAAQAARQPMAEQAKTLIREIDHLAKLAQKAQEATVAGGEKAAEGRKLLTAIAEARVALTGDPEVHLTVTGALKRARYFEAQAEWLLSRFPEGRLRDVEGLVKLVDMEELAANQGHLTDTENQLQFS